MEGKEKDSTKAIMHSICDSIRSGEMDVSTLLEINAQQKKFYPLMLAMEKKALKEMNIRRKKRGGQYNDSDVFVSYEELSDDILTSRAMLELVSKIHSTEEAMIAIEDLLGNTLPVIVFSTDGKPNLLYRKFNGSKLLEEALGLNK